MSDEQLDGAFEEFKNKKYADDNGDANSDMFYIQTKEEFKEEKENYNEEYCFDDMTIIDYPTLKDIDFKEFKAIKSIMNKQKENREWYLLWNSKNGQKVLTLIE